MKNTPRERDALPKISGQVRLEGVNDTRDALRQLMERWDDRPTLADPRLEERYLKSKLLIRVYSLVRQTGVEHVACLQRFLSGSLNKEIELGKTVKTNGFGQVVGHLLPNIHANVDDHRDYQAVLVGIVQLVEHPELVALPSLVRFQCQDVVYGARRQSLYYSSQRGFIFLRGVACPDEKRDSSINSGTGVADQVELLNEVVERCPEILDGITSDNGDVGWKLGELEDAVRWASGLRINLGAKSVQVAVENGRDDLCELRDVMFGPFDL